MPLRRLVPLAATVAAAVLSACGDDDPPPVPLACTSGAATVIQAVAGAPGAVQLDEGGTRISDCLRRARSQAELQDVGVTLTTAGEELEALALAGDEAAGLRLGYLAGAAREAVGTSIDGGPSEELVYRLEQSAGAVTTTAGGAVAQAVERGRAAGAERG